MNQLEFQAATELAALGWRCTNKGWPDLLMYRDGGKNGIELLAVEVKSRKDKVRPEQMLVLTKLATVMPVYVLREGHDGKLREAWVTSCPAALRYNASLMTPSSRADRRRADPHK